MLNIFRKIMLQVKIQKVVNKINRYDNIIAGMAMLNYNMIDIMEILAIKQFYYVAYKQMVTQLQGV